MPTVPSSCPATDVKIIRDLAAQVMELADSEEYETRRQRWRDVNERRRPDRAPVWCRPAGAWAEIMPHVVHVHGKFFDVRDGREPVVPFEELFRVLVENGYTGYVSSEYEGWHWNTEADAFEMVEAQQALSRQVLQKLATTGVEGGSA